jgi:arsenate reductase-like glutaredoxin family protein
MTCKKAQGFLESHACAVSQTTDAAKVRQGPAEAKALLRQVKKVVAMKGKKVETFDLAAPNRPDDETVLASLIGPTGNLRAPTLRVGDTLLVGFNEEAYRQVLGE